MFRLDWGTVVQRMHAQRSRSTRAAGACSARCGAGFDWDNPAGDLALRGNGKNAWFGWPDSPKLEAIRDQWLRATDLPTQKALAADMQRQAFVDAPCMPLGLYYQPVAYRADLTGHDEGADPVHRRAPGVKAARAGGDGPSSIR